MKEIDKIHGTWYKFSNWMVKTFGKDLHGEWQYLELPGGKKLKHRTFDEKKFSGRIVGYEVRIKIEKFVKRACPDIIVVPCDDALFSGSIIILVPHPTMGITVLYVPQCTTIQNQFFLYENHCKELLVALKTMSKVYKTKE